MQLPVLTVRQLNGYVKSMLEGDPHLSAVYLKGEISNFKNHYQSGHLYMSLKDSDAVIRAEMFRFAASSLRFEPCDGMSVICRGRVSLYERDGSYQFYIEEMIPDGVGDLALAFEQIKERLSKEGLFDSEHKKAIPSFPRNVGVITSDTGAAVQDIINVLSRRNPLCNIVLCPVHVQGEHTVPDILDALKRVQQFDDIDVLIIGRGGGSIEDLWAFNSEELARAIYNCKIPVISAVGHETDFTICDFVSDLRAPTPSAAAELASPDILEITQMCDALSERLSVAFRNNISMKEMKLKMLSGSKCLSSPIEMFKDKEFSLEHLKEKLTTLYDKHCERADTRFISAVSKLNGLSPLSVLSRGFCVAEANGKTIKSASELNISDNINLKFSNGSALCSVLTVNEGE